MYAHEYDCPDDSSSCASNYPPYDYGRVGPFTTPSQLANAAYSQIAPIRQGVSGQLHEWDVQFAYSGYQQDPNCQFAGCPLVLRCTTQQIQFHFNFDRFSGQGGLSGQPC